MQTTVEAYHVLKWRGMRGVRLTLAAGHHVETE